MATKYFKMSDPSRAFYDITNGLDICNHQVKPCDNFTPMTNDFIRNGGIVEVSEEDFQTYLSNLDMPVVLESSTPDSLEGEEKGKDAGKPEMSTEDNLPEEKEEITESGEEVDSFLASIKNVVTKPKSKK